MRQYSNTDPEEVRKRAMSDPEVIQIMGVRTFSLIYYVALIVANNLLFILAIARPRVCKPVKQPRNRFLAWRAGTTTIFDVTAGQAT